MRASSIAFVALAAIAPGQLSYQRPPDKIASVMEDSSAPIMLVSPTGDKALMIQRDKYRSIAQLASPMLPLAGTRVDPVTNGSARPLSISCIILKDISTGSDRAVQIPSGGRPYMAIWAPNGARFVVLIAFPKGIRAAVGATDGRLRLLSQQLSAAYGTPVQWMPDGKTLLIREIPADRGQAPTLGVSPVGPEIQESLGSMRPARTLPDAIKDTLSEQQFDYFMRCRLALVDTRNGTERKFVLSGLLDANPSPDGKYLLINETLKPYSRRTYSSGFPRSFSALNIATGRLTTIAKQPGEDGIPLDGVVIGPRNISWDPSRPSSLVWVEALDGGNPKNAAEYRDQLIEEDLPGAKPRELLKLKERFQRIEWTERGDHALLNEYNYARQRVARYLVTREREAALGTKVSEVSTRERYANPGAPLLRELPNGKTVLVQHGPFVYLTGPGSSPQGDHPFLDRFNLDNLKTERIWQSDQNHYERIVDMLLTDESRFITLRESPTDIPNYFLHSGPSTWTQLTHRENHYPELLGIKKKIIKYKRNDGVDLSFTLYLPAGYRQGDKLPAIADAYPLEFTNASTAGQVTGSAQTFPVLRGELLFLLAGYAVMENVAMPIVGNPKTVNDSFVEQLVADADAARTAANETGSIDTSRLGVMGHSYGAFMTANLMAHSDVFRAGAAESGAYNRSLTPFGFQSERRTFWEAPGMYLRVSPFAYADKIKRPLLLIHGLQDDNPGTYTIQSERLFQALSGNGGTTRLVLLPFEAHGYAAKESIEHVFWEELRWFDKYVKGT